jgi:hypothetical protein
MVFFEQLMPLATKRASPVNDIHASGVRDNVSSTLLTWLSGSVPESHDALERTRGAESPSIGAPGEGVCFERPWLVA